MRIQFIRKELTGEMVTYRTLKQKQMLMLQKYIGKFSSFADAAYELGGMPEDVLHGIGINRKVNKHMFDILNEKVFKPSSNN